MSVTPGDTVQAVGPLVDYSRRPENNLACEYTSGPLAVEIGRGGTLDVQTAHIR